MWLETRVRDQEDGVRWLPLSCRWSDNVPEGQASFAGTITDSDFDAFARVDLFRD